MKKKYSLLILMMAGFFSCQLSAAQGGFVEGVGSELSATTALQVARTLEALEAFVDAEIAKTVHQQDLTDYFNENDAFKDFVWGLLDQSSSFFTAEELTEIAQRIKTEDLFLQRHEAFQKIRVCKARQKSIQNLLKYEAQLLEEALRELVLLDAVLDLAESGIADGISNVNPAKK